MATLAMNRRMVDKQLGCWIICHGVVGFVFKFCSNSTNIDFSTPFLMHRGGVVSVRERCPRWCRVRHPCRLRYPESFGFRGKARPSADSVNGPPPPGLPRIPWMARYCQAIRGWPGTVVVPLFWLSLECCSCMPKCLIVAIIPSIRIFFSADRLLAYTAIAALSGFVGSMSDRSCLIQGASLLPSVKAVYSSSSAGSATRVCFL